MPQNGATSEDDRGAERDNDMFPALKKYKAEHCPENLQKLCVEISEFCRAVYASTLSKQERDIYNNMLQKLINKV